MMFNSGRMQAKRQGFTVLELLVVIACLSLLAALLLAAVQSIRESARRVQCINNLHQFGIALHSYESNVGVFPSGQTGRSYSLHSMVLPQLEQAALYNSINFSLHPFPSSSTALLCKVSQFVCPSDFISRYDEYTRSDVRSWTNYAGCSGNGIGVKAGHYNGIFPGPTWLQPRHIGLRDVKDGASSTVLMSEWLVFIDGAPEPRRTKFESSVSGNPMDIDSFVRRCQSLKNMRPFANGGHKGLPWISGHTGMTLYNHVLGINNPSCMNIYGSDPIEGISASSNHPGGAVVLFADGRAQFVRDSVDLRVWRALATCQEAEPISYSY